MIPFKSVYDKLNIFRDRLSETVEDLGETSVEIIHGEDLQVTFGIWIRFNYFLAQICKPIR